MLGHRILGRFIHLCYQSALLFLFSRDVFDMATIGIYHNADSYNIHVYMRQDGLAGTVTADLEYPPRVAFVLLTQVSRVESRVIILLVRVDHVV